MSQQTATADGVALPDTGPRDYIRAEQGLWSWLSTVDHKRIALMYLATVCAALAIGGFFALALRTELWSPGQDLMDANHYNQAFTFHGAVMTFIFIIPSIPGALGNFLVPAMIGAKDVAFPKLNLLSLYLLWIGAVIMLSSLLMGGLDTGWTFYVPYSTTVTTTAVINVTFGVFVLGFSSVLTGLNFIVTIHKLRAPGLTWYKMPLILWSLYATSIVQMLATPVLGITLLLLIAERTFGVGIFDPALGGDPVLYQHFFWFYSHPAVYIMILPAMGVISEIIAIHSRQKIFGYTAIAYSSVAIALVGFLVWGHHMFVSGQSQLATMIFSFLTFFVAIPSGVKVFNWTSTLWGGSIKFSSPMLYALGFLVNFSIGGLTGLFLGVLNVDLHLHDTYFVVSHFHYVMVGSTIMAFLGGLTHWWPKLTGKMVDERIGKVAAVLVFIGFNLTFFIQLVMGTRGMPRRYYSYLPQFEWMHRTSTIGAYVLGLGLCVALYGFISSLRGAKAPKNPWGGLSLEWEMESPPVVENFEKTPVVKNGPYDFGEQPS